MTPIENLLKSVSSVVDDTFDDMQVCILIGGVQRRLLFKTLKNDGFDVTLYGKTGVLINLGTENEKSSMPKSKL